MYRKPCCNQNNEYKTSPHDRGSKVEKHHRYYDYDRMSEIYDKFEKLDENPRDKIKHIKKYRRTYISDSEYENDFDYDTRSDGYGRDYYSQPKYKTDNRKSYYSPKGEEHQRKPLYISKYQRSESGTVIDYDSDSVYTQWETPRGKGESYYTYQERNSRESNVPKGQRRRSRNTTDNKMRPYQSDVSIYAAEVPRGQNPYMYKRKESKFSDENNDEVSLKGQRRCFQDTSDTKRSPYRRDVDIYAAELPRGQNPYRYQQKFANLSNDNNDEASLKGRRRLSQNTTDTKRSPYRRDVDVYATELHRGQNSYRYQHKLSNLSDDNNNEAFLKGQRRRSRDTTDNERSLYGRDIDIYAAELPRGQNSYMDKWIESKLSEAPSETETQQTDGYSQTTALQSEHQVYVASKMPNNTAFSQERLISVIDYNANTSPLQQKHKNNADVNSSEIVFLPVIFQNEPSNKQHITSTKLKMEEPEDEPSQNKIQVFVAGNLQQENIFEKSHSAKHKEQSPSGKKKSKMATDVKRNKSKNDKLNEKENEYPVNKPYINVVTSDHKSKSKSPVSKGSKSSIGASKGKKKSKVSPDKKGNKVSMAQKHKQSDFTQEKNKKQDDLKIKSSSNVSSVDQNSKSKQKVSTSVINGRKKQYGEGRTKSVDFTDERKGSSRKEPNKLSNAKSESKHQGKSSKVKNDMKDKEKQQTDNKKPRHDNLNHKSQDRPPIADKRRGDNIKGQTSTSEALENKKSSTSLASEPPKRTKSITKKRKDKKDKQHESTDSMNKSNPSQNPEEGYEKTSLAYVFQAAQFFLGLTIHDKVMELVNYNYNAN